MLDTATTVVLIGFAVLVIAAFVLKFAHLPRIRRFCIFLCISIVVWLAISIPGEFFTGWATNSYCYQYLGCNEGFFGYDAVEHLLFGFSLLLAFLFLGDRYEGISLITTSRAKSIVTLLAYVALAAVIWEMFECGWDQYRVVILHETLFSFRLHIDALSQSSNLDTMGDISSTLLGAFAACGIAEFLQRGMLRVRKGS